MRKRIISTLLAITVLLSLLISGCTQDTPGYAVLVNEEGEGIIIDADTGAIATITYPHYEIHEGSAFDISGTVDLANGAVRDIQITTPNTTEWAHLFLYFDTEAETQYYLYENVVIVLAGAAIAEENLDRNSAHVATTTMAVIDNANVANANADTTVAGATILLQGVSGAGKDGGAVDHGHEWILKQNEDYSLRFVANAAGNVNYHLSWYEQTNR